MTAELFIHPLTSNPTAPAQLEARVQDLTTALIEACDIQVPVRVEHTGESEDGRELGIFIDGPRVATVEYGRRERLRIDQREVDEREQFGEPHGYPQRWLARPTRTCGKNSNPRSRMSILKL
ncbi:hypothetical protein ACTOVL_04310 [Arcanobacterium canis]